MYTGNNFTELKNWVGKALTTCSCEHGLTHVYIHTLEGKMYVSEGDMIIKGVEGEYYPCRSDIFEKTYEKVDSNWIVFESLG